MSDKHPLLSNNNNELQSTGSFYYQDGNSNNNNNNGQMNLSNNNNNTQQGAATTTQRKNAKQQTQQTLQDNGDQNINIDQSKRESRFAPIPDQPLTYEDLGITETTSALEAKHAIQNHMFGFRPFKSKIIKKKFEDRSPEVRHLYTDNPVIEKGVNTIGNYIYSIFFGSLLYLVFIFISLLLSITYFGIPYAKILWGLKEFVFWPFGKYLQLADVSTGGTLDERQPLRRNKPTSEYKPTISLRIGSIFWYLLAAPLLIIFHGIILMFSWLIVIMIPTAKIHTKILINLLTKPMLLRVERHVPRADCQIVLYPVEAFNAYYYKFTVNGMNVCLVNLLPFVILSIIFGYFFEDKIHPVVIFSCCILSTIPLSYYNGMAIASLSAQTSFAMGALINASFGSIIELILYIVTINGQQEEVARSALTGALLGAMLLIPGLSMVVGGIKHKEQKFNPTVMGVSTVLLMIAVIGAFAPTIFYKIYGNYSLACTSCVEQNGAMSCGSCAYVQKDLDEDPVYTTKARTLMYIISGILPVAYLVGLLFTLKTHTHILHPAEKSEKKEEGEEHSESSGESEWSKTQCIVVLCACTTMFALVSEKLVESIDPVVSLLGLTREFLGVTILGIIPSAAEYLNAIQFALNNNMPLALEIGASAAVQITLFQMPVLVFVSAIINHLSSNGSFTLIFPLIDFFAVFFGVIVMNFVFNNGRTNYFIGSTLCIVYLIIVFAFYFTPDS